MKAINRIKKSEDFAFAVKKGTAKRNGSFSTYFIKNDLNFARIGISVSSKLGNAVTRNRIKRQMRAMCKDLIDISISYDIVIVAKNDFLNHTYIENKELLANLVSKQVGI